MTPIFTSSSLKEAIATTLGTSTLITLKLTVCICKYDVGILPSQLQRYSLQITLPRCLLDQLADLAERTDPRFTKRDRPAARSVNQPQPLNILKKLLSSKQGMQQSASCMKHEFCKHTE
ncbi:hypothetical protein XENOCAPTIV_008272 [Xenoophorus captivus]|uniref:Uncharacterized protein n=1 Tax=Xenoophorus captivus TaxID=1517983 RepID=A0ABV0R398_9TELE